MLIKICFASVISVLIVSLFFRGLLKFSARRGSGNSGSAIHIKRLDFAL